MAGSRKCDYAGDLHNYLLINYFIYLFIIHIPFMSVSV